VELRKWVDLNNTVELTALDEGFHMREKISRMTF
jgi:hypothetical protein